MSFSIDASSKAVDQRWSAALQLRLHQRQLRKAADGRPNGTGIVASGAGRI